MDEIKEKLLKPKTEGIISIIINLILFIVKLFAGFITGSVALIADAWHTMSDSLSSVILLMGINISQKPPDKEHPFGHGRADLVASLFIGVFLAIIGFNFVLESIDKFQQKQVTNFGLIGFIATVISIVVKELLARYAFYVGKLHNSNSVTADGWHHRSDALSSLLILPGIIFGNNIWWMDSVLGIIVSLLLFYASYDILKNAISPLLGETANKELLSQIKQVTDDEIKMDLQIHHVHIHNYGNHKELSMHIVLPDETTVAESHNITDKIEKRLKLELNINATVHVDPQSLNNFPDKI